MYVLFCSCGSADSSILQKLLTVCLKQETCLIYHCSACCLADFQGLARSAETVQSSVGLNRIRTMLMPV